MANLFKGPTRAAGRNTPADGSAEDEQNFGAAEATLDPGSFNAAYEVLRRNAETLRDQEELDIDRLVPLVEQSMQAYRICRARLDAVRLALESHLNVDPASAESSEGEAATVAGEASTAGDDSSNRGASL